MICFNFFVHRLFQFKEGGWDNVLTAWRFEMGSVWILLALVRGEILGPWMECCWQNRTGLASRSRASDCPGNIVQCPQFRKEAKVDSPPVFAPMPSLQKPDETLAQSEMSGKVTWSKATSVIPWPVAQERAFGRPWKLEDHSDGQS